MPKGVLSERSERIAVDVCLQFLAVAVVDTQEEAGVVVQSLYDLLHEH